MASPLAARMLAGAEPPHYEQLARHVARSRGPVRAYALTLEALARQNGIDPALMSRHNNHARIILKNVMAGVDQSAAASSFLRRLHEETAACTNDGESNMDWVMGSDTHKGFVKALEKEFKVKAHHFDEVGTGVYVYLDEEDTEKMGSALNSSVAILDRVYEKLGYIMLRRGTHDDLDFGSFGERHSKWIFTHVPTRTKDDPEECEGVNYSKQKLANLERALKEALHEIEPRTIEYIEETFREGPNIYSVSALCHVDKSRQVEVASMSVTRQGSRRPAVTEQEPVYIRAEAWLRHKALQSASPNQ